MNFIPVIILVIAIALFLVSYSVYSENKTNQLHLLYARTFLAVGYFFLIVSLIARSFTEKEAWIWIQFLPVCHLVFPLIFDSLLLLLKDQIKIKRIYKNLLLFSPFCILFFIDILFPELTIDRPKLTQFGWIYINKTHSGIFLLFRFIYLINIAALVVAIVHILHINRTPQIRRFLTFFGLTFFLPVSAYMILTFMIDTGTEYSLPYLAIFGGVVLLLVPLFQYKLNVFDISFKFISRNIFPKFSGNQTIPSKEESMAASKYVYFNGKYDKICLPVSDGYLFVKTDSIIRIEAEGSYSIIYFDDRKSITICKPLATYEKLLEDQMYFLRIHRSYLVNLKKVTHINTNENYVTLADGEKVPISVRKKTGLLQVMRGVGI